MVSCNLYGRMGNQMFQIACCVAYALKHGLEYHIPAHTLNDLVWPPVFTHLENPNWNPNLTTLILKETTHSYDELPTPFDAVPFERVGEYLIKGDFNNYNIIIDGYRQSYKYFEDYLPEIRKAFGFDYTVKKPDVVCLHKRLGDYKLYPTRHCIISDEYIYKSLNAMGEKGFSKCIVFSDEISECEQTINSHIYPNWSFRYSKGRDQLQDFQLMLECGNFILSASTYSLMASILSNNKEKICIAPAKWFEFENKHLDTKDICPQNYIKI